MIFLIELAFPAKSSKRNLSRLYTKEKEAACLVIHQQPVRLRLRTFSLKNSIVITSIHTILILFHLISRENHIIQLLMPILSLLPYQLLLVTASLHYIHTRQRSAINQYDPTRYG